MATPGHSLVLPLLLTQSSVHMLSLLAIYALSHLNLGTDLISRDGCLVTEWWLHPQGKQIWDWFFSAWSLSHLEKTCTCTSFLSDGSQVGALAHVDKTCLVCISSTRADPPYRVHQEGKVETWAIQRPPLRLLSQAGGQVVHPHLEKFAIITGVGRIGQTLCGNRWD